jgi:hypothetical protein
MAATIKRIWGDRELKKILEENRIENPLGNAAETWLASGRVLFGRPGGSSAGCLHGLRGGTARTASQDASGGRRGRKNALTLSDVCVI